MRYLLIMTIAGLTVAGGAGCLRMKVDPIEVKPITLNVNLRIDRELDDFFDFERELGPTATTAPAAPTLPAATTRTLEPITVAPSAPITTQPLSPAGRENE